MKTFLNSVLAGVAIGIAGTVNLSVENRYLGAALFGFGLFLILCYSFKLYTGAVGYLVCQKRWFAYLGFLLNILLGNLVGTFLVGWSMRQTRCVGVVERAVATCDVKLADGGVSLFILSLFCGILMYIAVESFRRKGELPDLFRAMLVFLCVMIFILSGFEHCIANAFYFAAAGYSPERWGSIGGCMGLMILGNGVGGVLLPLADKVRMD
ncbi:MAG: formate/nitrite transporter family protein [Planctomycetia bacterium]|nr:formate/nitrite transporter family protein [Planctomycetia bacterium]